VLEPLTEGWLVGGAIRDRLLGRPILDMDVVVEGDPEEAARAVAAAQRGPVFPLSEAFGAWRVLSRDRRTTFDFSPLHGATIEEDLSKRDFTVNAMAQSLDGGPLIDPHGGERDVREGLLRAVGPHAYDHDPLRALRLVRLAAELGFRADADTERLTRTAAPRLSEPSPERVFAELRRLMVSDGCLAGLDLAERLGVLAAVLPELTALQGVEQSRFHHLDVYHHTMEVLAQLVQLDLGSAFGDLAPQVETVLTEPLADELSRGEALRFAALFHDIGKPATRGEREDGRVTFIGHDAAGERIAGDILRRLRASERLRTYVAKLTREHLVLGFMVHDRPLSRRAVHAYLRRCEPVEVEVTVLSSADRMATRGEDQEPWIEAHLDLAREVMAAALVWREQGPPRPLLRGDELAAELGVEPGPELGRLLRELEEAVYAGDVKDRDQALALARELRQNPAG
jgi:putative nucleotidyltransferase with HDIG domain